MPQTEQKDEEWREGWHFWNKCSLIVARLNPIGQSAGTVIKTKQVLVFCALKKAMLSQRKKTKKKHCTKTKL